MAPPNTSRPARTTTGPRGASILTTEQGRTTANYNRGPTHPEQHRAGRPRAHAGGGRDAGESLRCPEVQTHPQEQAPAVPTLAHDQGSTPSWPQSVTLRDHTAAARVNGCPIGGGPSPQKRPPQHNPTERDHLMKVLRMVVASAFLAAGIAVPVGAVAHAAPAPTKDSRPSVSVKLSGAEMGTYGLRRTPRY